MFRLLLLGGGPSSVAMSGTAPATSSATGTLTVIASLSGSAACGSSASGTLTTVVPLPPDLAAAIKAFFESSSALTSLVTGGITLDQTGNNPKPPYVVFKIGSGNTIRTTDVSLWFEHKVRFECIASKAVDAEAIKQVVHDEFNGAQLDWANGYSLPFVQADRTQMGSKQRGKNDNRVFMSLVVFSVRCREDR